MASWWMLGGLFLLLIFVESGDSDDNIFWPFLVAAGIFASAYFILNPMLNIAWDILKWALIGYVPLGLVWSAFKYRKFCTKQIEYARTNNQWTEYTPEGKLTKNQLETYNNRTSLSRVTGRITYWIVYWPLSAMVWLVRDFVVDAFDYIINKVFKRMYDAIRNSVVKNIDIIDNPTNPKDKS